MSSIESKFAGIRGSVGDKIKKWESRIVVGPDVKPHTEGRAVGDEWEDSDGKQWVQKQGYAMSISKTAEFRDPLFCPKCQKTMNHKFDTKTYRMHRFCYDCTIKWHTQMRMDGTYEEWERRYMRREEKAYLTDMIEERKDYIRTFRTPKAHYSNGGWDELAPMRVFEPALASVRKDIEDCKRKIALIETEEAREVENDKSSTTNTAD